MISDFVNWWNYSVDRLPINSNFDQWAEFVAGDVKHQFYKHFAEKQPEPIRFSLSQLYRPTIVLALAKLQFIELPVETRVRWIFGMGDYTETLITSLMCLRGHEVTDFQYTVEWEGMTGHIDFVVDGTLIDVKTMSHTYWTKFIRNPNDERGYLTQLGVYQQAMDIKNAGFLCFNKATGEMQYVDLGDVRQYVETARQKVALLQHVQSVDDIYKYALPPAPEKSKKTKDWLIPESMKNCPVKGDIYCSEDGETCDIEAFLLKWPYFRQVIGV
jgi:hypothetical protein